MTIAAVSRLEKNRLGYKVPSQSGNGNAAQMHERANFLSLLRELCDTIPQPPQGRGRPRLPLSDMVFGVGVKVYSTMSGRRQPLHLQVQILVLGLPDRDPGIAVHRHPALPLAGIPEV